MAAINWIEAGLGLALCGTGLYLAAFRKANAGVRLQAGVFKLSVSNTGAFLLLLGAILMALARISAVSWKDIEIQLNQSRQNEAALAGRMTRQQGQADDAAGQLAAVAAAARLSGAPGYAVPDMAGLPLDRAVALIRSRGLDTLAVRWVGREQAAGEFGADTLALAPGSIIGQGVAPGVALPRRSRVLLTAVARPPG